MKQPEFDAQYDKAIICQKLLNGEHIREIKVGNRVGIMTPSGINGSYSFVTERGPHTFEKFFDRRKSWFRL